MENILQMIEAIENAMLKGNREGAIFQSGATYYAIDKMEDKQAKKEADKKFWAVVEKYNLVSW